MSRDSSHAPTRTTKPLISHLLLLLPWIALHIEPSVATSISFTTYSASSSITQVCTSGGYPDVCCTVLDLDIHDGHGYGWSIASQVAFVNIESASATTAIYDFTDPRPCTAGIVTVRHGNHAWQKAVPLYRGGAGSASAVTTFRPLFLRRRFPEVVVIDDVYYMYTGTGHGEVMSFRNAAGSVISGKYWQNPAPPTSRNITDSAAPLSGTPRDRNPNREESR